MHITDWSLGQQLAHRCHARPNLRDTNAAVVRILMIVKSAVISITYSSDNQLIQTKKDFLLQEPL